MKNYNDMKGKDRIRLEYIYSCQKEINYLRKILGNKTMNLQEHKLVQYLKKEVQKNLNSLGK